MSEMFRNKSIFISTPISGFEDIGKYKKHRHAVLELIEVLRKRGYTIYSEIEEITGISDYESPGESVAKDFRNIADCDVFMLLHPAKMQSSSLIEFGYACALDKPVVIVADRKCLPYLVLGYEDYNNKAILVETKSLNCNDFLKIINSIQAL